MTSMLARRGAIVLAMEKKADFILIDDARGRSIAVLNGLTAIGTVGIIILAKRKGLIGKVKPILDKACCNKQDANMQHAVLLWPGSDA